MLGIPLLIFATLWYTARQLPPEAFRQPPADAGTDRPDAGQADAGPVVTAVELRLPNEYPKAVLASAQQTVPIIASFKNGVSGNGTAFLYMSGILVTAAHIIDSNGYQNLTRLLVYCGDENTEADLLAIDTLRDVAVLAADCGAEDLRLDTGKLKENEALYITGFNYESRYLTRRFLKPTQAKPKASFTPRAPELMDPRIHRMLVETAKLKIPRVQAVDGTLIPGNSGSPVIRPDGSVIGMVVLVDRLQGLTFMVPAVNIRHVLREAGVK
jgi:S1-C subfamily serine protease